MAGYIRLCHKNPDKHQDRRMKTKIIEAKLKELVGGKPDQAQLMLIRGMVPLYLMLETWRKDFIAGQELHPDYMRIQARVTTIVQQLMASNPSQHKATSGPRKVSAGGFDLMGALDA